MPIRIAIFFQIVVIARDFAIFPVEFDRESKTRMSYPLRAGGNRTAFPTSRKSSIRASFWPKVTENTAMPDYDKNVAPLHAHPWQPCRICQWLDSNSCEVMQGGMQIKLNKTQRYGGA